MSALNGVFERRRSSVAGPVLAASLTTLNDDGPDPEVAAELTVTADVRLDNRTDLLTSLALPVGTPLSDSSLIARAWRKWGTDCPRHLIGDFALVIWDARQQLLFCARDHIGARPLYYSLTPERFVFASDIRGVLSVPDVSDRLDDAFVAASLLDNTFFVHDRTHFMAVRKLPSGHSLTILPDRERVTRYWFPDEARAVRFSRDADYVDAARELYTQAVRDRLQTPAPVGVHLSGGLDSSSVAALAARERRRQGASPPAAFCWQPPPDAKAATSLEHANIEAVCAQEGLAVQYCPMTTADTLAMLRQDPARAPVTTTMMVETTTQRQASAQGIRVILSGWGGDEGLSSHGHGYCAELLLRGQWHELYRQSQWRHEQPWKFIALEALLLLCPDRATALRRISTKSWRAPAEATSWIRPDFLRTTARLPVVSRRQTSVRSTLIASWEDGGLTERIESWHAHGARHGIAYAYPMLDRRLLEFVAGLPPEQFVLGNTRRSLMRRTLAGILPAEVHSRQDKDEPLRSEQGRSVARETLGLIGQELAAAPALPARSRYLDMPRLLQRLQSDSLQHTYKVGHLLRTVQFLDF